MKFAKFAAVAVAATVAATVALATTAVVAQNADAIAARKPLMKGNGSQAGVLTRMVRGTDPYDAAKVAVAFDQFAETARKFGALFPENSKEGDTRAAPAIWTDRAKFEAEIAKFAKNVDEGRVRAMTGLEGLKDAMGLIGGDCASCHEDFRKAR